MIDSLNFFENQIMLNFIQILLLSNLGIMKQIQFLTVVFLISVRTLGLKNLKIQNNRYQAQQCYNVFKNSHLNIIQMTNRLCCLSYKHQSPFIAKKWTETVFEEINSFYNKKIKSSLKICYLLE